MPRKHTNVETQTSCGIDATSPASASSATIFKAAAWYCTNHCKLRCNVGISEYNGEQAKHFDVEATVKNETTGNKSDVHWGQGAVSAARMDSAARPTA